MARSPVQLFLPASLHGFKASVPSPTGLSVWDTVALTQCAVEISQGPKVIVNNVKANEIEKLPEFLNRKR